MSSRNRIYAFQRILLNDGHVVTVRKTRGDDIYAACGQLAGQVADRDKAFLPLYSDSGCNGAHANIAATNCIGVLVKFVWDWIQTYH